MARPRTARSWTRRATANGRTGCSTATSSLWTDDPAVGEAIAERLGWLDAPIDFADNIAGSRGVRRRDRRRGLHDRGRGRDGRQQPRPGRPAPDVRVAPRATWTCASSTRPTRRPSRPTLDDLDPLRTLVIVASKSGTTVEPNAFLADAWDRAERGPRQGRPPRLRRPGRDRRGHHRPGQEPRGDPAPR